MKPFDSIGDKKDAPEILEEVTGLITGKSRTETEPNVVFNVSLKKDVTALNLAALPYIAFFTSNLVGFFNTQMIFMIRDPNSFNLPENQIGNLTSRILLIS